MINALEERKEFGSSNWSAKGSYENFFVSRGIKHKTVGAYLAVGEVTSDKGWIFHVTLVRQLSDKLGPLLDYLIENAFPFTIPSNDLSYSMILDGRCGFHNVGKICNISIANYCDALVIARQLISLSAGFFGPEIPTAFPLNSVLYVSYAELLDFGGTYISKGNKLNPGILLMGELSAAIITWPFSTIKKLKPTVVKRLINGKYLPVQSLKNDPKGNVIKCIRLNKIYNMEWCALKTGIRYQSYDKAGLDATDRLEWQYKLHQFLAGKVALPKVLELSNSNGNAFLAFEFIEGVSFQDKIIDMHQGTFWPAQEQESRREIINYLIQILEILEVFHKHGLVHRDVTPGNFLVTSEKKIVAIDIELCCSLKSTISGPIFLLGTPGYMSPQQYSLQLPVYEDDIFAFGALMFKAFSGISPNKFNQDSVTLLFDRLLFFTGSYVLSNIILQCINYEPENRPSINEIKKSLAVYEASQLLERKKYELNYSIQDTKFENVIFQALKGLTLPEMFGPYDEWSFKSIVENDMLVNEDMNRYWYPGFASGVSGVMFTIAIANNIVIEIVDLTQIISSNLELLNAQLIDPIFNQPGLWNGTYGIAVALTALINSGFLENSIVHHDKIYNLLSTKTWDVGLGNGLAGQGLAILFCQQLIKLPNLDYNLNIIISDLLGKQQKDGSWYLKQTEKDVLSLKMTGFAFGNSGIAFFLLSYYEYRKDDAVLRSILSSLRWLTNNRKTFNGQHTWSLHDKSQIVDPWLEYGFSGVALTFIRAYEVLRDPIYKEVAVSALYNHPKYISSNYLTTANGLSGIGEVYLKAYQVFEETEWKERADHIAGILINAFTNTNAGGFWLDANYTKPTADIFNGSSGIIQFLMRINNSSKSRFPF